MRELGWAAFGEVARALAAEIGHAFRPGVVVGIAKGGVFVGGALAAALGADFYPVRIEKRRRDAGRSRSRSRSSPTSPASGSSSSTTSPRPAPRSRRRARWRGRRARARSAPRCSWPARDGARPDFSAFATDELILFGWDYQLDAAGSGHDDPGEVGV